MMDGNSKSTRMKILKQKLMLIESQSTLMSPSIAFPRVRNSSSNSDAGGGGGGVEGGGKGGSLMFDLGDANADQSNLDVSGLAPLDESVFEASSIHCQNFFPPPPSLPPHRHVSPTDGGRGGGGRVRHASDWNLSSSTAEAKRGEVSRGNHFDDANFNCGLTLPTSASKKKPGKKALSNDYANNCFLHIILELFQRERARESERERERARESCAVVCRNLHWRFNMSRIFDTLQTPRLMVNGPFPGSSFASKISWL